MTSPASGFQILRSSGPRLIAGLGNPGPSYAHNRHNIGFMAVDRINAQHRFSQASQKFGGSLSEGRIVEGKTFTFKPLSFMNHSGHPLGEIARFYKIPPEHIIVIHDELDLPPGKVRIKRGGGHGGHNGLKSIDSQLGPDYWRVRVGIGHPGSKDLVSPYVLSDFSKQEWPLMDSLADAIARYIESLLHSDETEFMNKITLATKRPSRDGN